MDSIEKLTNDLINDPVRAQFEQLLSSKPICELDWEKLTPIVEPSYSTRVTLTPTPPTIFPMT